MLEIEKENLGIQEVRETPLPPPCNLSSRVLVRANEQPSFSSNSKLEFPGLR